MVSKELDIVRQCIEMIEQETVGLFDSDVDLNGSRIEELLRQDEGPLEESLDRLLRATLSDNELLNKVSPSLLGGFGFDANARDAVAGPSNLDFSGDSTRAAALDGLDMAGIAAMLGNLYEEASAPATVRSGGDYSAHEPGSVAEALQADMMAEAVRAQGQAAGSGGSGGDREMVDALKRKLSMLTVGIRFLHTQIEEKSQNLLVTSEPRSREVEHSLVTPEGKFDRETITPSTGTSTSRQLAIGNTSLGTANSSSSALHRRPRDTPNRQVSNTKRGVSGRGGQPPTVTPRKQPGQSQRGGSLSRSDRQSLGQTLSNEIGAKPRASSPGARGSLGPRNRTELGRESSPPRQDRQRQPSPSSTREGRQPSPSSRREAPRDTPREPSPPRSTPLSARPGNQGNRNGHWVERLYSTNTTSSRATDKTAPTPRLSDRGSQGGPRWNTSIKKTARRDSDDLLGVSAEVSRQDRGGCESLPRPGSRNASPARGERPRRAGNASPGRGGSSNLPGHKVERTRSCDPPTLPPNENPNGDVDDSELPFGWRQLLSESYKEVTGRPMVDRIRLVEISSASGRRIDTHVYWLHAMVRWADLRLVGSERCGERGEDLTLFVLHSWQANPSADDLQMEAKHHRRRTKDPQQVWNVASVRVLNSLNSAAQYEAETAEFVGRLGAILLYDALGPLLVEDGEAGEVEEVVPDEPPPLLGYADDAPGSPPVPEVLENAPGSLSPLPPAPTVAMALSTTMMLAANGSLSVPTPGYLQAPAGPLLSASLVAQTPPGPLLSGSLVVGGCMTPRSSLGPRTLAAPQMGSQVTASRTPAMPQLLLGAMNSTHMPPTVSAVPLSARSSRGGR